MKVQSEKGGEFRRPFYILPYRASRRIPRSASAVLVKTHGAPRWEDIGIPDIRK
jgi:hypothetical protein